MMRICKRYIHHAVKCKRLPPHAGVHPSHPYKCTHQLRNLPPFRLRIALAEKCNHLRLIPCFKPLVGHPLRPQWLHLRLAGSTEQLRTVGYLPATLHDCKSKSLQFPASIILNSIAPSKIPCCCHRLSPALGFWTITICKSKPLQCPAFATIRTPHAAAPTAYIMTERLMRSCNPPEILMDTMQTPKSTGPRSHTPVASI
jgi:hypothetical protein